jgi:predicted DNA-binding transcriptional regulator YafY
VFGASRPATRLLAMLELLETRGRVSGRELAERLEVDPRTVRRYAVKLEELGIPLEADADLTAGTACVRGSSSRRSCSRTPRRRPWSWG